MKNVKFYVWNATQAHLVHARSTKSSLEMRQ
jgi:hypothetical protein